MTELPSVVIAYDNEDGITHAFGPFDDPDEAHALAVILSDSGDWQAEARQIEAPL